MTTHRRHPFGHALGHRIGYLVHGAVHDAVDYALHHRLHLLHHDHPDHHHRPPVVHAADGQPIDDLEQRVLMSAVPAPLFATAAPLLNKAAAVAKTTVVKTTTTSTTAGPKAVADPGVTGGPFAYQSFAADPLFAPGGPSINDVSQGELGDCYLLAALSSVAKTDPALIRQSVAANANGTYTVKFAGGGGHAKAAVTVDADLPTIADGRPAYAQLGSDDSLWVAVVEKAYADYVNPKADSYATIAGGWMGDVFSSLGLKASATFSAASATSLATLVQKDLKAGDFVTMGTTTGSAVNRTPLVGGHAYEIDSVTLDANGTVTAITLRNPWGNDLASGGYVTVTPAQALVAFAGLSVAHT